MHTHQGHVKSRSKETDGKWKRQQLLMREEGRRCSGRGVPNPQHMDSTMQHHLSINHPGQQHAHGGTQRSSHTISLLLNRPDFLQYISLPSKHSHSRLGGPVDNVIFG